MTNKNKASEEDEVLKELFCKLYIDIKKKSEIGEEGDIDNTNGLELSSCYCWCSKWWKHHCMYNFLIDGGSKYISDFMHAAGEPITWIEALELWRDMRSTNDSTFPSLEQSLHDTTHSIISSRHDLLLLGTTKDDDIIDSQSNQDISLASGEKTIATIDNEKLGINQTTTR